MKKIILFVTGTMLFVSCSKNAEQIDAAKAKLADMGDKNAEQLDYTVTEVNSLDFYKKVSRSYRNSAEMLGELGEYDAAGEELKKSSKFLELADKDSDETYYIVTGLKVAAGDTIHRKIFYVDDKNQVVEFENLK